jgi:hypothetical protein
MNNDHVDERIHHWAERQRTFVASRKIERRLGWRWRARVWARFHGWTIAAVGLGVVIVAAYVWLLVEASHL